MCGRFTLAKTTSEVERYLYEDFDLDVRIQLPLPRYNIAPRQKLLALNYDGHQIKTAALTWGFVPGFSNKDKGKLELINTRIESLEDTWFLKEALNQRRCLIVADGFYEWEKTDQGKLPYRVHVKDEEVFYFAGLYSKHSLQINGEATASIMTKESSDMMKVLHHRMPVMLRSTDAKMYLLNGVLDEKTFISDPSLKMYPVSKKVNKVDFDQEVCIKKEEPIRLEL